MGEDEGDFLVAELSGEGRGVKQVCAIGGEGAYGFIRFDDEVEGEGSEEWLVKDE